MIAGIIVSDLPLHSPKQRSQNISKTYLFAIRKRLLNNFIEVKESIKLTEKTLSLTPNQEEECLSSGRASPGIRRSAN